MKRLKFLLAAFVVTLSLSTAAFAGDPKTEVKDTKSATTTTTATAPVAATPAKAKSKDGFVYWVTGKSGSNYTLSTGSQTCLGGTSPCKITSENELDGTVDQSTVDNQQDGIAIVTMQPGL